MLRFGITAAGALSAIALLSAGLAAQPPGTPGDGRGRWVQTWAGEAPSGSRVEVRGAGRIVVRGTDRPGVRYKLTTRGRARRGQGWVPVVFKESGIVAELRSGDTTALTLRNPECGDCRVAFVIEIEVPRGTREVDLVTRDGGVDVRGIGGSVRARVAGGHLAIDDVGGSVAASTAGGNIRLGTIGGQVTCDTAGGSIELARSTDANLRTSVGSIRAMRVAGDLNAETGGGSIEIGSVRGVVRARTGGGSIRVAEVGNGMHAEAEAGDIWIERASGALVVSSGGGDIVAGLRDGARLLDSLLETSVGSVVISLPGSLALTLDASIGVARGLRGIVSDFPSIEVHRVDGQIGAAAESAAGSINGGGSLLRIRNGVGRIEIRRQP